MNVSAGTHEVATLVVLMLIHWHLARMQPCTVRLGH